MSTTQQDTSPDQYDFKSRMNKLDELETIWKASNQEYEKSLQELNEIFEQVKLYLYSKKLCDIQLFSEEEQKNFFHLPSQEQNKLRQLKEEEIKSKTPKLEDVVRRMDNLIKSHVPNWNNDYNDTKKLMDTLEKSWWATEPYMGNCGNCQKYAMLRPQDAGMFCYDC